MPWSNDPSRPGSGGANLRTGAGGDVMGGGGSADPSAAPKPDPTGFGGLANQLGITSNYSAETAKADYGGKGYGYGNAGYQNAGQLANDVVGGRLGFGNGAYVGDPRVNADYAQAAKQAGNVDYDYLMAQNIAGNVRQQGLDAAAAQGMALAKSGNPMQSGMAAYNAQNQNALMGQQAVQQGINQSAQMKQAYDQMRLQQDLQNRQMNLGLLGQSQQNAQFGAQFGQQGAQMNQDLYKYLLGLQQGYGQQALQGQMGYASQASANFNHAQDINAGVAGQQGAAGGQTMAAAMAAAAAMMSDERVKRDVRPIGSSADGHRRMGSGESDAFARGMSVAAQMLSGSPPQAAALPARSMGPEGYGVIPTEGIRTAGPLNPGQNLGGPGHEVYDLTSSQANAVPAHAFYREAGPAAEFYSDERLKSHMGGGGNDVERFMGTLQPVAYRYKDGVPGENPGAQRYGILAQDVERSPMGRSLVEETPMGKAINIPHATGALLAGEGELYARQRRLEAELHALKGGR